MGEEKIERQLPKQGRKVLGNQKMRKPLTLGLDSR